MLRTELEPCPFCGGAAIIEDLGDPGDDSFAHCVKCSVQQIADHTPESAAVAWNTRPQIQSLEAERDTPKVVDYAKAVQLEAWHQRDRWGSEHDAGKTPFDWFWLIGYLTQKAAHAAVQGDADKALHHTVSTGAALANWHLALSGGDASMRPGIEPPQNVSASQ